jgi:hypothetical protein
MTKTLLAAAIAPASGIAMSIAAQHNAAGGPRGRVEKNVGKLGFQLSSPSPTPSSAPILTTTVKSLPMAAP